MSHVHPHDEAQLGPLALYNQTKVTQMEGTVKWFNDSKGFGFITPSDGGKDVFVHQSDIEAEGHGTLNEGDRVQYEVAEGPKGPKAANVKTIASTEDDSSS